MADTLAGASSSHNSYTIHGLLSYCVSEIVYLQTNAVLGITPCALRARWRDTNPKVAGNDDVPTVTMVPVHWSPAQHCVSVSITSISFFKKLAGRLASTTARTPRTIIPHVMAYVSVVTELAWMTRYFPNLVSLRTVEVTSFVYTSNVCHGLCFLTVTFILYFQHFDYSRSLDGGVLG